MVTTTLKTYWKQNCLVLFFTSIESGGIILSTIYLAKIMDSLISKDKDQFVSSFLLSLFLWGIALLFGYVKSRYIEVVKQRQLLHMRNKLVSIISEKSYMAFHENDSNEYTSWLSNDMNTIEEQCFGNFYLGISSFTLLLFSAIAILNFNWVLLAIAMLAAFLMTVFPKLMRKNLDSKNKELSSVYGKYLSKVDEWIKGYPTLISYNKHTLLKEKLAVENQKLADVKNDLGKTRAVINASIRGLSTLFQYSIILVTGLFILSGKLTGGVIFAIGDLTGNFFGNMSFFIDEVTAFLSTAKIIDKATSVESESITSLGESQKMTFKHAIKVQNLTYQYSPDKLIDIPNMTFVKGGKYAILGKSGKGKSTFLNILSKNLPYSTGSIRIDDRDIKQIDDKEYRKVLSYIKQDPYVFDLNLTDNLTLFDAFDQQKIASIIRMMDLSELEHVASLGLFGKNVSGGQAQRVEIGRSLIQENELLLIDEGTSNLDQATSYIIEKNILSNPNLTVIFVTHHLNPELEHLFTDTYSFR